MTLNGVVELARVFSLGGHIKLNGILLKNMFKFELKCTIFKQ